MSDMETAYKIAALAVRQRFAEQRPAYLAVLDNIKSEQLAVYEGEFDQAEKVLDYLNVPNTLNPTVKKLEAQLVFVNCSNQYDKTFVDNIANYVSNGAWLVSSDWALGKMLSRAFPGMVEWAQGQTTANEVISVEPNLNSLWSEVVVLGADPQWWLEVDRIGCTIMCEGGASLGIRLD